MKCIWRCFNHIKRVALINYAIFFGIGIACNGVLAGIPVWTFTPLTPTTIILPNNAIATIQYRVTNQSSRTHQLVMTTIPGIHQNTSSGYCGNPFQLEEQQSCILNLQIDGHDLTSNVNSGPVVCEHASPLQCYQPSWPDRLVITLTSSPSAHTIGGVLSGLKSTVVLQNNGADNLLLNENGTFTFPTPVAEGSRYNVTILTQPQGQACDVENGSGTMGNSDISDIVVRCATNIGYVVNYGSHEVLRCPINVDSLFGDCVNAGNTGTAFEAIIGVALNRQATHAYITDLGDNAVLMCPIDSNGFFGECIDLANNQQVVNNPISFYAPYGVILNRAGNRAYVANTEGNTVSVCDVLGDGTFSTCVDSGNSGSAFAIPLFFAFNPDETIMYVTNYENNQVLVCPINNDGTFGDCQDSGNMGLPFDSPIGIAVNPSGTRAYVVNGSTVYVCPIILPLQNTSVAYGFGMCQDVGNTGVPFSGPFGIALDRLGYNAYVTNGSNNTVTICPILDNGLFGACVLSGNSGTGFIGPQGLALYNEVIIH